MTTPPMMRLTGVLVGAICVCLLMGAQLGAHAQVDLGPIPGYPDDENLLEFAVDNWPPMVSEDMEGFGKHSQHVTEIFSAMGFRVKFVFLSWPRAYELTRRGDYIGTFPWLKTPQRDREFLIPEHGIAQAYQKGFYKASRFPDGLDIKSFDDVKRFGLRPVVVASYWQEQEFKNRGVEAEIVANPEAAWRFLDAGRGDIMFEEVEVARHDLVKIFGEDKAMTFAATDAITIEPMFILISREHPDGDRLLKAFDAFMDTPDGQSICQKWSFCRGEAGPLPDTDESPEQGAANR